jgi:putative Holliday junction resolvase
MPERVGEETLLAFDVGAKKIGVAMGNTLMRQARALEIIPAGTRDARFERIAALLKEWQPQRIVVGLSLATDGGDQPMTAHCKRFANQMHGRFGLPVVLVDERYSSMLAQSERPLRRGEDDDALAAAVILQRWFDDPDVIQLPVGQPPAKAAQASSAEASSDALPATPPSIPPETSL